MSTALIEPECAICLQIIGSSAMFVTECKHMFHIGCINKWRKSKNICPLCRYQFEKEPIDFCYGPLVRLENFYTENEQRLIHLTQIQINNLFNNNNNNNYNNNNNNYNNNNYNNNNYNNNNYNNIPVDIIND
jgi:hypothetical protein